MTLFEYEMRMRAYNLRRIDREYDIHLQAWVNRSIKAEKKKGKSSEPVYKSFKQFYDYDQRIQMIERHGKSTKQEQRLKQIALRQKKFKERRKLDGDSEY